MYSRATVVDCISVLWTMIFHASFLIKTCHHASNFYALNKHNNLVLILESNIGGLDIRPFLISVSAHVEKSLSMQVQRHDDVVTEGDMGKM